MRESCDWCFGSKIFHLGADDFSFQNFFFKKIKIAVFVHGRLDPVLELQFVQPLCVVCNSFAFCNSVSADRSGMAASSFIAAAGACVILLCFAAESHKLHCNGSMKVGTVALTTYFSSFWRILCSSFSV